MTASIQLQLLNFLKLVSQLLSLFVALSLTPPFYEIRAEEASLEQQTPHCEHDSESEPELVIPSSVPVPTLPDQYDVQVVVVADPLFVGEIGGQQAVRNFVSGIVSDANPIYLDQFGIQFTLIDVYFSVNNGKESLRDYAYQNVLPSLPHDRGYAVVLYTGEELGTSGRDVDGVTSGSPCVGGYSVQEKNNIGGDRTIFLHELFGHGLGGGGHDTESGYIMYSVVQPNVTSYSPEWRQRINDGWITGTFNCLRPLVPDGKQLLPPIVEASWSGGETIHVSITPDVENSAFYKTVGYRVFRSTSPSNVCNDELVLLSQSHGVNVPAEPGTDYYYAVRAVDNLGNESACSNGVQVSVPCVPIQVGYIADQVVFVGNTATFSAEILGAGLQFQWYRADLYNAVYLPIPGATESSYTTPPVTESDDLSVYSIEVWNSCGIISHHVPGTPGNFPGQLRIETTPTAELPTQLELDWGTAVTLQLENLAHVSQPSFQWKKNGIEIAGATEISYTFVATQTAIYSCEVRDGDGYVEFSTQVIVPKVQNRSLLKDFHSQICGHRDC
ncbi:MAG: hypothetical protein KDD55_07185 [Bdellovibrionales bacterium]|nr:hypothetical protein [Bdellovibrionales bacterium]